MNDRSVDGKMWRIGMSGIDIRTGLSLRRGGRWCGNLVCEFRATPENTFASDIPCKKILTCISPSLVLLEKDRFGG